MNIKYFLLIIFLCLCFGSQEKSKVDSIKHKFGYIESEKDIQDNSFNFLINREIDLYSYELSIGKTIPLKGNIIHFNSGNSISLLIKTPYKTPKIINRYEFDISTEISLIKMNNKPTVFSSSINATSIHLILNNKKRVLDLSYGLGFTQLFSSQRSILSPSLKMKVEYELRLFNWYLFLINNGILSRNKESLDFLQRLHLYIGFDPQVTFGVPFKGKTDNLIMFSDIYFRINLFSL
tara:strand:+ start:1068 stop:1775 length:708 start_codon:yes stop_codon:yes gene_type:complete